MGKPNSHEGRMYPEEGEKSLSGHYTDRMRKQTLSGESSFERCIDSDRDNCSRNRSMILLSILCNFRNTDTETRQTATDEVKRNEEIHENDCNADSDHTAGMYTGCRDC